MTTTPLQDLEPLPPGRVGTVFAVIGLLLLMLNVWVFWKMFSARDYAQGSFFELFCLAFLHMLAGLVALVSGIRHQKWVPGLLGAFVLLASVGGGCAAILAMMFGVR